MAYNLYDARICEAWKQVIRGEEAASARHWYRQQLRNQVSKNESGRDLLEPLSKSAKRDSGKWSSYDTYKELNSPYYKRPGTKGLDRFSQSSSSATQLSELERKLKHLEGQVLECKMDNMRLERELSKLSRTRSAHK
uniref:Uncharacterized protein n=1 Tax=Tetraselmis sp. GSL018 TaxID=582737 RepID=A0A061SNU0_9CHLO